MAACSRTFRHVAVAATALTAILGLTACATSSSTEPTPYIKAKSANGYGYSSMELSENEYRIMFKATEATDAARVQEYSLFRAAELASAQGYDWVAVVKTDVERKLRDGKKIVRESNNTAPPVLREEQCTMSGCYEAAQPFETSDADMRVEKTRTKDIYYSIVARMANSKTALGERAFRTQEVLSRPPGEDN
ncbi:hypothetical protein IT774_06225 [Salinimonas marina]|uniref:Lipoprotein n=1 Tax=Salinimonas marina TaxID=2785918 RepID=A0A7S9DZD4_9ALTE|nr:hypothetical protein [Salinimonas marina]QPG06733.1 hypothetical protein IT774_06225 [Salinimonas marina]